MNEERRDLSYLTTSDSQQMAHGSQQVGYHQVTGCPQAVGYQPVPTGHQPPGYSQMIGYQPCSAPDGQLHYTQPAFQHSVVIVQPAAPPTIMAPVPQQSKPDSCVIPALLTCLFCFFPTGLVALYYASRTTKLIAEGNITEARTTSEKVRNLVVASLVIGLIFYIVFFVLLRKSTRTRYH